MVPFKVKLGLYDIEKDNEHNNVGLVKISIICTTQHDFYLWNGII